MEFINNREFNQENLGRGLFGTVYHYEDKAIKHYHPILYKHDCKNPCLKLDRKKFTLMKMRAKDIKHTFLVEDLLYIQGEFSGVIYPYIEGEHLGKLLHTLTLNEKRVLGRQIIRNAKELTDHQIYPSDYRLPNILRDSEGKAKIIDIDDFHTKVSLFPNPLYLLASLRSLRDVLIHLLEDDDYFRQDKISQLEKYNEALEIMEKSLITYNQLKQYLYKKTRAFKTIFINIEDINSLEDLYLEKINMIRKSAKCNVILITDSFSPLLNDILKQIPIYDCLETHGENINLDNYLKTHKIINPLLVNGSELYDIDLLIQSINYLNSKPKKQKIKTL